MPAVMRSKSFWSQWPPAGRPYDPLGAFAAQGGRPGGGADIAPASQGLVLLCRNQRNPGTKTGKLQLHGLLDVVFGLPRKLQLFTPSNIHFWCFLTFLLLVNLPNGWLTNWSAQLGEHKGGHLILDA